MLELHLAAYASLSDRSPSILLPPACSKLPSTQSRGTCCSPSPWKACSPEVSFPEGLSCPGCQQNVPWCSGAGKEQGVTAALGHPAQIRMSSLHPATRILYLLFSSWGTGLPHHLTSPSPSLLSSFAFNYFFNIWGERSMWQEAILEQVPRRELSGNKPPWALVPCNWVHREGWPLAGPAPLEREVSIPTGPAHQPCIHL